MNSDTTKKFIVILLAASFSFPGVVFGQATMPEILEKGTLKEQMDYLQERTRIYNDFRAIREDMFQKIKSNAQDSLNTAKRNISSLRAEISRSNVKADSLSVLLQEARDEREEAVRNKDMLSFLGIRMNKIFYNTIMWAFITGLSFLVVVLFLTYKGNRTVTVRTKKDLEELREEFETFRKQSRERYEKLVVSHHHEIQKLREGRG